MGTQKGIIKLGGSIDGLTFYTAKGKDLVRKSGGPTKEQIQTGENFEVTRQNNREFGGCSRTAKSFRTCIGQLKNLTDGQMGNRLTQLFKYLLRDDEGVPGQRPIRLSIHRQEFKNFECNDEHHLFKSFPASFAINHNEDRTSAGIIIPSGQIDPVNLPKGATHFQFIHALGTVSDFIYSDKTNEYVPEEPTLDQQGNVQRSPYLTLADITTSGYTGMVSLPLSTPLPDTVSIIHAFGIVFFQRIASVHLPFKQGKALKVVEIF